MAINPHFAVNDQFEEQKLIDELIREAIQCTGIEVLYLPRTIVEDHTIFGEDRASLFSRAIQIEVYLTDYDGFTGQDFLSRFAMEIKDAVNLDVSKSRFRQEVGKDRPEEGDVIFFPFSQTFFMVKFVEHEKPFYQLGKNYIFSLKCEAWSYSHEVIDTDNVTVDDLTTELLNDNSVENNLPADNNTLQTQADEIIDETDPSPFGEF